MKSLNKPIIVITGPTASGKTALAVALAGKYGGEVINADSRSIYKKMNLGTGKPTIEEMNGIPHHLFDLVAPDESFSLVEFQAKAKDKLTEIWKQGKIPFVVGGTGLYIDSLIYNFSPAGKLDEAYRGMLEGQSAEELYEILKKNDPETAITIDPRNKRRTIRALEVLEQTGKGKVVQESRDPLPDNVLYLAISVDRATLYNKLNKRVETWLSAGFEKEVENLNAEYGSDAPGMSGIGYKQFTRFLRGEISRDEAIEKFKQGDRNLAKKQLTWFRRNPDILWVDSMPAAEKAINNFLASH